MSQQKTQKRSRSDDVPATEGPSELELYKMVCHDALGLLIQIKIDQLESNSMLFRQWSYNGEEGQRESREADYEVRLLKKLLEVPSVSKVYTPYGHTEQTVKVSRSTFVNGRHVEVALYNSGFETKMPAFSDDESDGD